MRDALLPFTQTELMSQLDDSYLWQNISSIKAKTNRFQIGVPSFLASAKLCFLFW
jgi:hypothetical protein